MNPSRRSVVRAAAWSAPAVALASSAPAFATSSLPRLVFNAGASRITAVYVGGTYYDLYFDGASVSAARSSGTPTALTMTVTWQRIIAGQRSEGQVYPAAVPNGWSMVEGTIRQNSASCRIQLANFAGEASVPIVSGSYFGAGEMGVQGGYTVVLEAPGYQSATWVI